MKILYLMHIDWDWIFQRPQILELALEQDYDCMVAVHKTIFKTNSHVTKRNIKPKKLLCAYRLPKEKKLKILKNINKLLYRLAIGNFNNYHLIWVCYPTYFDYIPADYKGRIVYDCMDNYVAMANEQQKQEVYEAEQKLIKRADIIFSSSRRLIECVPNMQNAVLVRNGYASSKVNNIKECIYREKYTIGYIGTISEWFDFQLLRENVIKHGNIKYHLIGPTENLRLGKEEKQIIEQGKNKNAQIVYHGVVEHSELLAYINDYDALIMPFVINETILSVDPVKLYEYISFGKCIISIWYPEIDRFSPFVYFYRNEQEYETLISNLINNGFKPKYSQIQQREFLANNTWEARYSIIKKELNKLGHGEKI